MRSAERVRGASFDFQEYGLGIEIVVEKDDREVGPGRVDGHGEARVRERCDELTGGDAISSRQPSRTSS